ncbi:MAG: carboxypeptidase-like regulatory domain-containing protein [Cryomorphaceae bacterium]|jgi:hypothetical protein|nr:carboxypeptidase-like regulatory domain-containing protein [Cryomorphaceae bacterium]
MTRISIFFFALIILASCSKKKAEFKLSGTVSDQTFSTPLSNASVMLYQVPVGSTDKVLVGTTTTNSAGEYSFVFPREKMEKYILRISKNLYFDIEETVFFSELSLEEPYIRNASTTAKSWAKLTFHNLNPQAVDHFQYIKQSGKESCFDCCPSTYQDYYGALDTSIYCINDGNTNYSYFYWVLGTPAQGSQTIYTTAFDTTEIILNY